MFKKIVLFAVVMFPVFAFAQETQKIAYLDQQDVIFNMQEYKLMMDSLKKEEEGYRADIAIMTEDHNRKYSDFMEQQDTLNEAVKLRRLQEVEDIRQRTAEFQQFAQQKLGELEQALLAPILEKFQKAVNEVGTENNFLYIANSGAFFYTSPNAINATPLVKKKLGIQ